MAISTDTSLYVAGITTYTIDSITDREYIVSYPVGTGVTHTRSINRSNDPTEMEHRLDSHLFSVNNKVHVGVISTVPPVQSEENP